jgi:hypothetical protein
VVASPAVDKAVDLQLVERSLKRLHLADAVVLLGLVLPDVRAEALLQLGFGAGDGRAEDVGTEIEGALEAVEEGMCFLEEMKSV